MQNILNSRQIAADIEAKLVNQRGVLCGEISRIYLSLSNEWNPCHGTINSRPDNLRTTLKKIFTFHFTRNVTNYELEQVIVGK